MHLRHEGISHLLEVTDLRDNEIMQIARPRACVEAGFRPLPLPSLAAARRQVSGHDRHQP